MDDLAEELAALFEETGRAHHQAFLATKGDDPDWPLWYAEHLMDKLPQLLGDARFTKSELVYLLISADRELKSVAPGAHWPTFYANFFMDRYML
jgi:hypothetical protein